MGSTGVAPAPACVRPTYHLCVRVHLPARYTGDARPLTQCVLRMIAEKAAAVAGGDVRWRAAPTSPDAVRVYAAVPAARMADAVAGAVSDTEARLRALYRGRGAWRIHATLLRHRTVHVVVPRPPG